MKPLILEFAETPKFKQIDLSIIEYSKTMNLTVLKGTNVAAISHVSMSTETCTKAQLEPSDFDSELRNELKILMGTETRTFTSIEPTDSDKDFSDLNLYMGTQTITESIEPTDSDR